MLLPNELFFEQVEAVLAEGQPVPACMKLAAKASAIAVTRPGASPSIPWREEVERAQLQELPAKV